MTGCERYHELISLSIDGEISEQERKILNSHLMVCPECRSLLEYFKRLSDEISDMQAEPPEMLASEIMKEIKRQSKRSMGRFAAFGRTAAVFAVIAIAVISVAKIMPLQDIRGSSDNNEIFMWSKVDTQQKLEVFSTPSYNYYNYSIDLADELINAASGGAALGVTAEPQEQDIEYGSAQASAQNDVEPEKIEEPPAEVLYVTGEADSAADAQPAATETPNYSYSSPFGIDLRAKDIWASNSFDKAYYCVAVISGTAAGDLTGYEQLSKSDNEIYYKVPVDIIEKFQENKSFTEILYNNKKASYGIVILKIDNQ